MLAPMQQRATISGLRLACEKEFGNCMSFLMSRAEMEAAESVGGREEITSSNNITKNSVQQVLVAAQSTPAFVSRTSVGSAAVLPKSNI